MSNSFMLLVWKPFQFLSGGKAESVNYMKVDVNHYTNATLYTKCILWWNHCGVFKIRNNINQQQYYGLSMENMGRLFYHVLYLLTGTNESFHNGMETMDVLKFHKSIFFSKRKWLHILFKANGCYSQGISLEFDVLAR